MNTLNDYNFRIVLEDELPEEPERLFTKNQLRTAIREVTGADDVVVTGQFSRSVTKVRKHRVTHEPDEIKVSWDVFADENRYDPGVGGWVVIMSSLKSHGLL